MCANLEHFRRNRAVAGLERDLFDMIWHRFTWASISWFANLPGNNFFSKTTSHGVSDLWSENLGLQCQGTQFSGKTSPFLGLHMRLRIDDLCYVLSEGEAITSNRRML